MYRLFDKTVDCYAYDKTFATLDAAVTALDETCCRLDAGVDEFEIHGDGVAYFWTAHSDGDGVAYEEHTRPNP